MSNRLPPSGLVRFTLALAALPFLAACGSNAGSVARAILCGSGHAKGKMTLGVNGDYFKRVGITSGMVTDAQLKQFLNQALVAASVPPSQLAVKEVESVTSGDFVRFLSLSGSFGEGFGVATAIIKSVLGNLNLLESAGNGPFTFIRESFNVRAAVLPRRLDFIPFESLSFRAAPHAKQWAYAQTDYAGALDLFAKAGGGKPVTVAVLDTGVDLEHPDLKDILVAGKNYATEGTPPQDGNGHGTHCAGIIASQGVSAESPVGVAAKSNVKIMPVKVLGDDGSGGFQNIEKGIRWATENGADVISMSLGGGLEYGEMKVEDLRNEVLQAAIDKGVIVVAAAGNESCAIGGECGSGGIFSKKFVEYTVLPCAYEHTICVGATDPNETLARYSNFASKKSSGKYRTRADMNAPGTGIYSTWPTKLGSFKAISGTSMATPFVAGMAALYKSADKSLSQEQLRSLLAGSQAFPDQVKEKSEAGRVDLKAAAVNFANEKSVPGAPAKFVPAPAPVEGPSSGEGGGADLVSTLWGAVCAGG